MTDDKTILVYSTFPSIETAEAAGCALVDARLAACVNIIPGLVSIYIWDGSRQRDQEVVMLVKTRSGLADRVTEQIRRLHPYDTPAVLVLPIAGGSADFMAWINTQTSAAERKQP